ncbi:MAG: molybdenum cofactor guanylyltransferase [Planctomycetes bacterium]|nr:molybdenum cofactor guanylyltransferase [Planctomycetota bacterium]
MGTNKALLSVADRPIIEDEVRLLRALFDDVLLSTNDPETFAFLALRTVADRFRDAGPLAGIHAGLCAAVHARLLVVACDLPFLRESLVRFVVMLDPFADVVVARIHGEVEPLLAVYSRACLTPIERQLARGQFKVSGFYGDVRVREVTESEIESVDPGARSFVNVNTAAELEKARRAARRRD